jgi:hypothetical protein
MMMARRKSSPTSMIAAEVRMHGADEEMKLPAAYDGELHLTPSFHFVSLKTRRVTADREDEKKSGNILGIQSRKEFR